MKLIKLIAVTIFIVSLSACAGGSSIEGGGERGGHSGHQH
jgi:hypothetical protein